MVFDWKNNREEALENGIYEKHIFSGPYIMMRADNGVVAGHTFINFEKLEFEEGTSVEDCVFENCGDITFDESKAENCIFTDVDTIFSTRSNFKNCKFKDIVGDRGCAISMEDGEITGCSFENIKLMDEAYLIEGYGEAWVENCTFKDIQTTREDRKLFIMEEERGFIIKKKKQFCFVDDESCSGLDQVRYIDGEVDVKPLLPPVLAKAVDKGILTEKQAEELLDKQETGECDTSSFDIEVLRKEIRELTLRTPTFNCLARAGFKTLEELAKLDELQALQIPNIGRASVLEVARIMDELGLCNTAWAYFLKK